MPDSRPLDQLRSLLAADFSANHASHATAWGDPKAMSNALRELKRSLGGGNGLDVPQRDVLVEAVREFGRRRKAANFRQLKYVCYGVTLPVESTQWRIIDRVEVFDALLHEVKGQESGPRQFRRCYQGLLSGYFGFDRHNKPEGVANGNWLSLRGFLGEKLEPLLKVSRQRNQMPQWLETLGEHRNLLHDDPCSRYANALKQGHSEELRQVCAGLGIENTSWVWEEALLAYVRSVANGQDAAFKAGLGGVMDLVNDRAEWRLPPSVATRATAMTVARYADCGDQPEHPMLRDTCLQRIGNPWLERTAWDAHVRYEPARQMIESWLKRRLIKDFFELLSHDGAADPRRLNYWIEWEPLITDMWFVLGGDARRNKSGAFMELRKRMSGRERWLDGSDDGNNAFVMRIGPLLVVEFGMTGNACYAYDSRNLDINLERRWLALTELKQRHHTSLKAWLSHNGSWEPRFDAEFRKLIGTLPRDLKKKIHKAGAAKRVVQVEAGAGTAPSAQLRSSGLPIHGGDTKGPDDGGTGATGQKSLADAGSAGAQRDKAVTPFYWPAFRRPDEPLQVSASQEKISRHSEKVESRKKPTLTNSRLTTVLELCVQHGVKWEDNRSKGGAFWVLLQDREKSSIFASVLDLYGFHYKHGKGFWFEKEG